ncbi:hyaluronidase-1 isoform X2 [Scleropages formosus]|uniref:Hyaluronidase n=1 Tax=Scleropages formosus TaxID=113540 RepID=A0A8C9VDM5_SCLFO|nr:hyaluronidase-1-like isoform X2 [Scleropages formosus]
MCPSEGLVSARSSSASRGSAAGAGRCCNMVPPLVLLCLWTVGAASSSPSSSSSFLPLSDVPFLTVWNAPTQPCQSKFGVDLDLGVFDIVRNQNETFVGGNVTIFYENKLGHYPRYTEKGVAVNGGVPQNASLRRHLEGAKADIVAGLPNADFRGLAVVDWESWRPLWLRNWDSKRVYREGSRALVQAQHPDWKPEQVDGEAQRLFEKAARAFMEDTLKLGRALRPGGLWGFYGFPCCYNYQYRNGSANYSGACPLLEQRRNDQLAWLWNVSDALYPDIYLEVSLRGQGGAVLRYVRHRVLEAMRAAGHVSPVPPPVLPYARIAYTYSLDFLSEEDLVHTVGESAALGAAGVVLWGDANYSKSQATCLSVKSYIDGILGRYVVNVTTAASLCSGVLCSGRGRCRRRADSPGAYLHLDPRSWSVERSAGPRGIRWFALRKQQDRGQSKDTSSRFECQCFPGWEGERCSRRRSH